MKRYIIKESELLELLEANLRLAALENGGVDNWEWYGDSLCDYLRNYCEWNNMQYEDEEGDPVIDYDTLALLELEDYRELTPRDDGEEE